MVFSVACPGASRSRARPTLISSSASLLFLLQLALLFLAPRVSAQDNPPRPPLMGDQVIAGVVFILFGLYYIVFGSRKHSVMLFLTGFLVISFLVYYACIKVRPAAPDDMARRIIYLVVALLLGAVFGFLYMLFLPRLGLFGIGGVGGFTLAMVLLSLCANGLIQTNYGRGIFIAVLATVFGLVIFQYTIPTLMLSTVLTGTYLLILGIDFFARSGYKDHLAAFTHATNSDFYHPGRAAYVLVAAWIVGVPVGLVLQGTTQHANYQRLYHYQTY
ncbi:hypothetical protein IWQ60_002156 [Tieghemiomyces parasiticus]|uniref:Transmembrane protein 198 n=2 Tax=Tieghemiomyces parasiticus TaxID=78921 RepID=A0A9W8E198_9FUNG|nr:hypothetical protein IWQ60_002156 [Tieghemiomyces parasiticus]